ncbi:putative uncharacterized protein [Clostridium sp. CAG:306]|nr:putative uncharacterized protein [Clostridium sp. CAG:306]
MAICTKINNTICMKRIFAILMLTLLGTQAIAAPCQVAQCQEQVLCEQHMFPEKNAPCNKVIITNLRNILCKGNVFTVVFDCKFWSDKQKAGDRVNFSVPEAIYTQEGTLLIPACSKLVATVIKIEKQRKFNKNARVHLKFECLVLPDGSVTAMSAKPFTKDGTLKEGPWMTAGKLTASTLGLGIAGAGAGVGFAFIPNPAKIGTGLAIGIPIGCTVGLITGLVTPGLKYHAKAGEAIKIILCDDLCIKKTDCLKTQQQ